MIYKSSEAKPPKRIQGGVMRRFFLAMALLIPLLGFSSPTELVQEINTESLLETYTKPLVTSFGTAIGTGLYYRGCSHGILGFDVGIRVMYIPIPDEEGTAEYTIGDTTVEASTIFGPKEGTTIAEHSLPGGIDIPGIPFFIPEASVGLIKGMEVSARFMLIPFKGDNVFLVGVGLKYNLRDFPALGFLPIDFGIQGFYHYFTLGDIITANNLNLNLISSMNLPIPIIGITPYLGIGLENTGMRFKYEEIDAEFEGDNYFRVVPGISVKFSLINVNVDYNIGKYKAINAGLSFGLR